MRPGETVENRETTKERGKKAAPKRDVGTVSEWFLDRSDVTILRRRLFVDAKTSRGSDGDVKRASWGRERRKRTEDRGDSGLGD